jgi:predicted RNase H-like nuclease (RuvC/YqgF family)
VQSATIKELESERQQLDSTLVTVRNDNELLHKTIRHLKQQVENDKNSRPTEAEKLKIEELEAKNQNLGNQVDTLKQEKLSLQQSYDQYRVDSEAQCENLTN